MSSGVRKHSSFYRVEHFRRASLGRESSTYVPGVGVMPAGIVYSYFSVERTRNSVQPAQGRTRRLQLTMKCRFNPDSHLRNGPRPYNYRWAYFRVIWRGKKRNEFLAVLRAPRLPHNGWRTVAIDILGGQRTPYSERRWTRPSAIRIRPLCRHVRTKYPSGDQHFFSPRLEKTKFSRHSGTTLNFSQKWLEYWGMEILNAPNI